MIIGRFIYYVYIPLVICVCLGRFLAFLFVRCWLIVHRHVGGLLVSFSLVASLYGVLPVM